jgi:hypothetical protein
MLTRSVSAVVIGPAAGWGAAGGAQSPNLARMAASTAATSMSPTMISVVLAGT